MQNLNLQEKIICHINYRDVFNAPVLKTSLIKWLGVDDLKGRYEFDNIINELKYHQLIIEKEAYFAVIGKESIIDDQPRKTALTAELIKKGHGGIKFLSKLPFVKYLGISGSLAADNPTGNIKKDHVDLDLFMIMSNRTLWLFVFFDRILSNLIRILLGDHFYCCNYVTEESFLEISNKNLYTATEIVNLKTIKDRGVFKKFIKKNAWYKHYYPFNSIPVELDNNQSNTWYLQLLVPLNYILFILFILPRTIKKRSLKPILELRLSFDPSVRFNLKRVCNPNGGYQELIRNRFETKFKINFKEHYSKSLIDSCFPLEAARDVQPKKNNYDQEIVKLFDKYNVKEK